jgi:hypothetical protein
MLRENRCISRLPESFTLTNLNVTRAPYLTEKAKPYVGENLAVRFSGVQLWRGAQATLGS